MDKVSLQDRVLEILQQNLDDPTLTLRSAYQAHPQWSSFKALVVVNDIEQSTQVLLNASDISACADIATLAQRIRTLQQA